MQTYPYSDAAAPVNLEGVPAASSPLPAPAASVDLSDRFREWRTLYDLGIERALLARCLIGAQKGGTTIEAQLVACGEAVQRIYFAAVARVLGLPFLAEIEPDAVRDTPALDLQLLCPELVRVYHPTRPPVVAIVPPLAGLEAIAEAMAARPGLGASLAVTTPAALRRAVWGAGGRRRVEAAVGTLFEQAPHLSARVTLQGMQGFAIGLLVWGIATAAYAVPLASIIALHLALSLFYLGHLAIRMMALGARLPERIAPLPGEEAELPVYTVLVALYRERAIAAQLVGALNRLDWPPDRLDIKLVCEADDRETIDALKAEGLAAHYEIVEVPPRLPRTKPKALAYALAGARGSLITVYDAEDRPHPGQLRSAYRHFRKGPDRLACLQAPLIVTNSGRSWLSALFALEYSALFRGLLPLLARVGLPLPLGGTSNHFRTQALRDAGGWDPYNVTEDADLGLRFCRLGYTVGVLPEPTLEEAPTEVRVWLAQRTRWFKGWLQTWLVLMREPRRLRREMGSAAFLVSQVLIAGMLLSSLSHPFILAFLVYLGWLLAFGDFAARPVLNGALLGCDIVNIFGSYTVFILLGLRKMGRLERRAVGWRWLAAPGYWLLVSLAAWRAVVELNRRPFQWNKTPHKPVSAGKP
ncbi:glycosyltransferase family 2 protein [Ensifer soli]|uniref:glycosyltransferase family 2 protein n=1 Tax=Ciceribacter sp. sgz301302 TaxID=3342379 RepID=UPI0035B94275